MGCSKWTNGWHEYGELKYYVENHRFKRGIIDNNTVYPYIYSDNLNCYNEVCDELYANKRNFEKIYWK